MARDDGLSMAAGQGFGTSVPEAGAEVEPTKGSGQTRAVSGSGLVSWEKEYKVRVRAPGGGGGSMLLAETKTRYSQKRNWRRGLMYCSLFLGHVWSLAHHSPPVLR